MEVLRVMGIAALILAGLAIFLWLFFLTASFVMSLGVVWGGVILIWALLCLMVMVIRNSDF